ncbi:hypothetical protein [Arthrobacter sp. NPDC056493]|uniref:hypothetical protein n=1 Tax=Arthrobacter sp. NPDC056493 TaxID=3345839 RepID=UPI00366CC46C
MSETSEIEAIKLMDSFRADVDRFRERAKAVANLLATASGALIAGLVFSSQGEALPASARILGYLGVGVLAVSVCLFLSASIYQPKIADDENNGPDTRPIEQLVQEADAKARNAARSISRRTKAGKWSGVAGLLLLCLMLPAGMFVPDESVAVAVQLLNPVPGGLRACPLVKTLVEGEMKRKDMEGDAAIVGVIVSRPQCGGTSESTLLYLERSKIVITADAR